MPKNMVDHVVATVDHQTGGPQSDRVPRHVLGTVLISHADEDRDEVWQAVEQAVESGRLGYDEEEQTYWVTEDGNR